MAAQPVQLRMPFFGAPDDNLQDIVDTMPSAGVLRLTEGEYALAGLVLDEPIHIIGDGAVVLRGSGSGDGIVITSSGVRLAYLTVENFHTGIRVNAPSGSVEIGHCNFAHNVFAVDNDTPGVSVTTTNCWFGQAGP